MDINIKPNKANFADLAGKGNVIPVYTDLMADFETPVSVYSKLRTQGPAFLLESIEGGANLQRYSILGCDPRKTIKVYRDHTIIEDRSGTISNFETPGDPLSVLEKEMVKYRPVEISDMPRFTGGAVGFIGYEYIHAIEPTVEIPESDPVGMPDLYFMITDKIIIFDRARQTIRLIINVHMDQGLHANEAWDEAHEALIELYNTLRAPSNLAPIPVKKEEKVDIPSGNMERSHFEKLVNQSKEYIKAGDIIQVVISQRFEKDFQKSPLDLYRALRTVNPSPYMFLYDTGEFALVGASPEVHVRLTDNLAEVRPIAGTRPRGINKDEDLKFQKDLLADEKERAEHIMLVDLARNDLGRVCEYGSVTVPEYMIVERYSHVMHIVSQVEGKIDGHRNAFDLMRATFPAGTVSGASKVRAMQIIAELENQQRGPYAGAVCYFSYDGNLDSCIAIRTALIKDEKIFIQSGAGLVADSKPAYEYQETLSKAHGMLKAVAMAETL